MESPRHNHRQSQGLAFFGDVFGSRFPLRKYDQVFLPEYGGAMENYGCVAWSDGYLTRSEPSHAERERLAVYLLHELAHMWFGNMVTMRWWDDLWLSETFAEFAALHAAERATRHRDLWAGHLATAKLAAYRVDQGPTAHPIAQPVDDVAAGAATFDAITYDQGASVLQQLMTYLGEAAFWAGIRAYLTEHAWGNATLTDLMDSLGGASGRDLNTWGHAWLQTFGPDRFTLRQEADRKLTLLGIGPQGRTVRPQVITLGAYRREEDLLRELATAAVEVTPRPRPWTPARTRELSEIPADADF